MESEKAARENPIVIASSDEEGETDSARNARETEQARLRHLQTAESRHVVCIYHKDGI